MIRIQTYNSTPRRIQAGGINPGNQPTLRTVSGREEDRTLTAMLQSGLKLTDIIVKEYVQNETTRVEQSLADMNAELAAERERYMRENQGQNALNAGEHFEQFARSLRDKTLADGKFQGRFADIFMKQASGLGFNFTEQGRSYARQQRGAWYDSVKKSMVSEIMNLAAQDYDDPDKIAYQLENYKSYLATIQHGLDNRGELNKVFQNVAETRVDGYLAHNRIADARDAFEESRDMLGDRANAVKVRIDARADALQAKAKQRQLELRAGLAGRIEDAEAAWRDGLEVQNPPTREEVAAAYGKDAPEVWERLEGLQNLSEDIRGLRAMSPAEQDSLLAERKPEAGEGYAAKSKIFSALAQAVERDRKARADDPAGYLASVEPEVKAARQAMFRNMTPDSVNAYAVALKAAREARGMAGSEAAAFLPESDAKQIAARLEDSPLPMEALQQLSASAGKYWPDMLRQFSGKEGLSGAMRLAASGMDADAGKKLLEAARDKDFAKKAEEVLGVNGATKTDFQNLVRESMADFNKTLLAGGDGDMPARINQNVERLALRYMMDGYETEEAVEKAAGKVILDRYSLAGPTGKQFRVPRKFNADRIGDGAEASLLDAAMPGKLLLPDASLFGETFTDRTYAAWIRREGYWVTNSDESGAVLFVGGQAVRNTDGSPVERTWDELEGKGMEERNIMGLSREYPW